MNAVCSGHNDISGDEGPSTDGAPLPIDLQEEEPQPRVGVLGCGAAHDVLFGLSWIQATIWNVDSMLN